MEKKLPVGLQLYSLRDYAEKDFKGTLEKVKEMGYDFVELAGLYGNSAAQVRATLDEVGIPAVSAHVPLADMMANPEKVVADYVTIGCKYIVIPYLPDEQRAGTDAFDQVMAFIPGFGKLCAENGLTLLYHNHDFEFETMPDGEYVLDYMYRTVPAELLQTEIDTCWVNVAGVNPPDYLRKYTGRSPVVHLKDFFKSGNPTDMYELIGIESKESDQKDAGKFEFRPIGLGMQVVPELLEAALDAGASCVVVEQDQSVGRTPMEAVTISRAYLKLLGW